MNCLLVNLVLVDLMVGFFLILSMFFNDLYMYFGGWVGDLLCKMLMYVCFMYLVVVVLMLMLMFIVWESYYVVIYFYSLKGSMNVKKFCFLIVLSWIIVCGYVFIEFWIIKFDENKNLCIYDWLEMLWKIDVFIWCIVLSLVLFVI